MTIWDLYFSTLVGWSLHPGYQKPGGRPAYTLEECAELATKMLMIRARLCPED